MEEESFNRKLQAAIKKKRVEIKGEREQAKKVKHEAQLQAQVDRLTK